MFCGLKLSCCWLVCCVLVVLQVQFTYGQLAHNFYAGRSIVSDSAFNKEPLKAEVKEVKELADIPLEKKARSSYEKPFYQLFNTLKTRRAPVLE
ncbi:unnamed protein product [Pocillopora meandrina]|uniref:Uncharacterized protein n=1 Tax=Pocillopora meandrina TaxID=46732 RepID=A0AAU9WBK1_9CNID|nr:unnamed protein product [Pocillopora meandrina]